MNSQMNFKSMWLNPGMLGGRKLSPSPPPSSPPQPPAPAAVLHCAWSCSLPPPVWLPREPPMTLTDTASMYGRKRHCAFISPPLPPAQPASDQAAGWDRVEHTGRRHRGRAAAAAKRNKVSMQSSPPGRVRLYACDSTKYSDAFQQESLAISQPAPAPTTLQTGSAGGGVPAHLPPPPRRRFAP